MKKKEYMSDKSVTFRLTKENEKLLSYINIHEKAEFFNRALREYYENHLASQISL